MSTMLSSGEETSGGLSRFSSDENGTVPFPRALGILLAACLWSAPTVGAAADPPPATAPAETKPQRDQRMAWWREARFGMFIHWGLYAIPAGEWKGQKVGGIGEWIMSNGKIPVSDYEQLAKQFNPVKFDARQWARIAKNAGMKYVVITSKHHDGFCLFDSKLTDYTVANTPFRRDILKELAEATRAEGLRMCWYHSIMDWRQPDYLPRRAWDTRPAAGADYNRFIDYMKGQLRELLTNYGPIGVIWFDGGWEHSPQQHRSAEVVELIRSLQPGIIINDRIQLPQDFNTPEQTIPPTGIPGRDWETCMTLNDTWGFRKDDHNWKSTQTILRNLIDIVSKGGNYLLNVGPTAEGVIPEESVQRLEEVGKWLAVNGEAIYGTTASPFKKLPWGRCTKKPGKLYLHVFHWPKGELEVPGLVSRTTRAYLLSDAARTPLSISATGDSVKVKVPAEAPDKIASVVVLEIEGTPEVAAYVTRPAADGSITLTAVEADVHGETARYESGDGKDNIGFWTNKSDWVSWNFEATSAGKLEVELTYACADGSCDSKYSVAVGQSKVSSTVEATGAWNKFVGRKLGTIEVPQSGRQVLSVKADTMPRGAVMNLKAVKLVPVK